MADEPEPPDDTRSTRRAEAALGVPVGLAAAGRCGGDRRWLAVRAVLVARADRNDPLQDGGGHLKPARPRSSTRTSTSASSKAFRSPRSRRA